MKTVAIYQKTENGIVRLGTFTPKKYYSIRAISKQFVDKHPNADPKSLLICFRRFVMGKYVDWDGSESSLVPFDMEPQS